MTTQTCPACGAVNASGNFCNSCGNPLGPRTCRNCSTPLSPKARFCHKCGEAVAGSVPRKSETTAWIVAGVASVALVGLELLPLPFPLTTPPVPAVYRALEGRPCQGALLELPIDRNRFGPRDKPRLYFQTRHGCPISGGFISRHFEQTSVQRAWRAFATRKRPDPAATAALRERLLAAGFGDIVIWRSAYTDTGTREREERAAYLLAGQAPWYSGADGAIYRLR
jgi:hypothetical protein